MSTSEATPEQLDAIQRRLDQQEAFTKELTSLLNKYSKENFSGTPDFVLAEYVNDCLEVLGWTIRDREKWFGRQVSEDEYP